MSKQLILITAPVNCGHCARALKELPSICEKEGWEFIEMPNQIGKNKDSSKNDERLPVDLYPTVMLRNKGKMVEVLKGYNPKKLEETLKKY